MDSYYNRTTIEHPEEEDVQMKAVHLSTDDDLAERPW